MTLENSNDYFVSVVDYGLKNIERTCLVFSLSKLFRIPGLRLGFVISDADIISRIATLKSAVSLNVPYDFQNLVANLWKNKDKEISDVQLYLNRRNRWLKEMCTERNIKSISHQSTHYRVIACPGNYDGFLLNLANAGIFVAPCDRMGLPNHIRINISCKDEYICKLLDQIAVLNVEG
jgi:aspartate/methionine/tyrosine aminotransferase